MKCLFPKISYMTIQHPFMATLTFALDDISVRIHATNDWRISVIELTIEF